MRKAWRWTKRVGLALLLAAAVVCVVSECWLMYAGIYLREGAGYGIILARHTLIVSYGHDKTRQPPFTPLDGSWKFEGRYARLTSTWGPRRVWLPWTSDPSVFFYPDVGSTDVPVWFVPPAAAGCLLVAVLRRRPRADHCGKCHYDLRGLPKDAAVCPECGAGIAGVKSAGGEA